MFSGSSQKRFGLELNGMLLINDFKLRLLCTVVRYSEMFNGSYETQLIQGNLLHTSYKLHRALQTRLLYF